MRNQAGAIDIRFRDTSHKRSRFKEKQKTYEIKKQNSEKKGRLGPKQICILLFMAIVGVSS